MAIAVRPDFCNGTPAPSCGVHQFRRTAVSPIQPGCQVSRVGLCLSANELKRVQCPQCQFELESVETVDVIVDICPGCGGSFYDFAELSRLFSQPEDELRGQALPQDAEDLESAVHCPQCQRSMKRQSSLGECPTVVDLCDDHGYWLQEGELGRLMDRLAGSVADHGTAERAKNSPGAFVAAVRRTFGRD